MANQGPSDRLSVPPPHMPHLSTAMEDMQYHPPAHHHGEYMRSPNSGSISVDARIPQTKKAMLLMSPACNFEAFSLHFHLPLKAAAEKFGVRATAFKKRCRAIGIRHWPYRKVRSLKRSLQELNRCKDQGALNDKQQYQYATFKKQLDKLMSPEIYGIDPSGRIPMHHFNEDDDDNDEEDSGDDGSYTSSQSPRYGAASFTECSISPAENEKTFGDFSPPSHLRSIRKQQSNYMTLPHMTKAPIGTFTSELPSMSHRLSLKESMLTSGHFKYPYGSYDHYLHDAGSDKQQQALMANHALMRCHAEDQYGDDLSNDKYDELHPTAIHDRSISGSGSSSHDDELGPHSSSNNDAPSHNIDYNSERFFDDVFLQISPDYGCLV